MLGSLPSDFTPQKQGGKTGKESLPERWILHKFTTAAREINGALAEREFSRSTEIARRFMYNELCDVYIENSKAIIRDGTEEEKRSAMNTLYTALEGALKMIHPFMPFLTEELWQRLPRRPSDDTPSVVVAEYPQYDATMDDEESERTYTLVLGCSSGIRSLIQQYAIKENGEAFVQCSDKKTYDTASAEAASIRALADPRRGPLSKLEILEPSQFPTAGSAVQPVSANVNVFIKLPAGVDQMKEIAKAQVQLEKTAKETNEQERLIQGLSDKVSEQVKSHEQARLNDLLAA